MGFGIKTYDNQTSREDLLNVVSDVSSGTAFSAGTLTVSTATGSTYSLSNYSRTKTHTGLMVKPMKPKTTKEDLVNLLESLLQWTT